MIPSISMCGVFCISSRSLNVPGSDSSALQTRYLSISPLGRNEAFRPVGKPAPPRPRMPDSMMFCEHVFGRHRERLAQRARSRRGAGKPRACSARARRCGRTAEASLIAIPPCRPGRSRLPRPPRARVRLLPGGSPADPRPAVAQLLVLEYRAAGLESSTIKRASSELSGPTYSPLTDAIGPMSQAPRHSKPRTLTSVGLLGRRIIASKNSSAPSSEHVMFVHTKRRWAASAAVQNMS